MVNSFLLSVFLVLAFVGLVAAQNNSSPFQQRIALLPDGMTVSWTTVGPISTAPSIVYGLAPDRLSNRVSGFTTHYDAATTWWHHVEIHGLSTSTQYFWQVITPMNASFPILQFTTAPPVGTENEFKVAIYGDLGIDNSVNTLILLNKLTNNTDLFWHVGDLSYADDNTDTRFTYEQIYEGWMTNMTTIWNQRPYMLLPGNHEYTCGDRTCPPSQTNFTAFNTRFHMPHRYSASETNMIYSFDYANVHFIDVSTETDYPGAYEGQGGKFITSQYDWLETDLIKATANRHNAPWIFVGGHRPFYSSDNVDHNMLSYFEPLFVKYHVDIVFVGHIHYYERMYSINQTAVCSKSYYNAPCPIYIVSGAAGNIEGLTPKPSKLADFSAVELSTFGIGTLTVHNNTAMTWRFIQASDDNVLDSVVITKDPIRGSRITNRISSQ